MRRHLIGVIALVLLSGSGILLLWPQTGGSHQVVLAACMRIGAVMAALWLAYPQLSQLPQWLFAVALGVVLVAAIRPRPQILLMAVPVVILIVLLRPRGNRS